MGRGWTSGDGTVILYITFRAGKEKNFFFTIKYRDEHPIYNTSKQSDDEHYLKKLLGSGTEWSVRPGRKAAKLRRCGMEAAVNSRRK